MKKVIIPIVAGLVFCAGCKIMMPTTTVSGTILGAPFKVKTPQNQSLQGLLITAEQTATNTTKVSVAVQSLSAVTDPNVVQATAAGQAQLLGATAQLVQQSASATSLLLQQLGQTAQAAGLAGATGGVSLAVPKAAAAASTNAPPK
jgi:hypothetical protein